VAQHDGRGNSSAARTEGHRWWTAGRGVLVDHGKAFGSSCVAGRGRRVADDSELHGEEDAAVELGSRCLKLQMSARQRGDDGSADPWPE
jgi:hypothetical protein